MNSLLTKKFPFAAVSLLFVLGMSCSKEPIAKESDTDQNVHQWEDSVINGDATMSRMMFSVGNAMNVEREETTRGSSATDGQSYTFDADELITIGVNSTYRASEETKNYKVTNTSTGALSYNGTATDAFVWKSASETISLRAWSYGDTSTTTSDPVGQEYTLRTDQSIGYGELLYAAAANYDYATYKTGIGITLSHMLSRVVINVSYDSGSSLTSIKIGDGTMTLPTKATFSPENAKKWTGIGNQTAEITPKTETANSCYSAVLIPTTYTSGSKLLNIIIGDETFSYILGSNMELLAGNQYNFSVKVKNRQVTFTVIVTAWTTDSRNITFSL